ncbi:MAG TPA: cation diffusion facilitator family transporter [Balneolaceae bacterium]|nr:cation diffusion facilitator family transporter [Balneolaceae bacterium]
MASSSKKVIYAAMAGNLLIALTKFVASFITGSSAMLSEGIHSTVDTGNQLLILLGLKKAAKPADREYPFGHGKEVYFWSFVVAIMIFAVGAGISIYEGIHDLIAPHPIDNVMMNYIVLGLAAVFEGTSWYFAFDEFRKTKGKRGFYEAIRKEKNPTTFVVLFEDSAAMMGLAIAFLGIAIGQWTGLHRFDGIASILIGLILGITAAWLAFETKGLLIGESADPQIVKGIHEITSSNEAIEKVNEVLTMHMGPDFILLNLSVDFQDDFNALAIENSTQEITREIKNRFPRVKRIFIEAENKNWHN